MVLAGACREVTDSRASRSAEAGGGANTKLIPKAAQSPTPTMKCAEGREGLIDKEGGVTGIPHCLKLGDELKARFK